MYDLWRAEGTKRAGMEKEVSRGIAILNRVSSVGFGWIVMRSLNEDTAVAVS